METAIIAGLVAGVISLIGFLVNIHIARKTLEANRLQLKYASAVKIAEKTIQSIIDFNKEIELLRIESWKMLGKLQEYSHPANMSEDNLAKLLDSIKSFENQQIVFFKKWAEIKGDIPDDIITVIRQMRHECRHNADNTILSLANFINISKKGSHLDLNTKKKVNSICGDIVHNIHKMLDDFDKLYSIINTLKNNKIESLLSKNT